MSIQKKSLINNLTAAKKAIIATSSTISPVVANKAAAKSVMASKTAQKVMANKAAAKSVVASKTAQKVMANKAHVIGNRVAMKVQY